MNLRDAIGTYRADAAEGIDQHGERVLARLSNEDNAAKAVAAITNDATELRRIIRACLECELLCRVFYQDVVTEKSLPQRLDSLSAEVADLDLFVKELDAGPPHNLAAHVALEPGEADYLRIALGRIRGLIEGRRRVAVETLPRFGATNKLKGGDETAALGWFAEGIEKITGRPHYEQVARLGEIILNAKDITVDRVKEALRTRRQRDWRQQ